jgi:hypothetical protein
LLCPDNLLSAVAKACRYEPGINPTYTEFAGYYGPTIVPARVHHSKNKTKVEKGAVIAQRFTLASLRFRNTEVCQFESQATMK